MFISNEYIIKTILITIFSVLLASCASEESRIARSNEELVLKDKLGMADSLFEEAKREDAEVWAPKTFAYTGDTIQATKSFIHNNPTATADIDKKSQEATFSAKRLVHMTRQSKHFAKLKPEEVALWAESSISQIAEASGATHQRDETLDEQVQLVKKSVAFLKESKEKLSARYQALQSEIEGMNRKVSSLSQEAKKAEAVRERNERFTAVSKIFEPNEAEVYRQGDKIIIRLKAIQFPSGGTRLGKTNFALLAKAKQALEKFPESAISVEGHTDSVGSKEINEKISQERAEAVRQYLISSGIDESDVIAMGMGPDRPIASNQTQQGRATNRRIDIVIDDSKASGTAE